MRGRVGHGTDIVQGQGRRQTSGLGGTGGAPNTLEGVGDKTVRKLVEAGFATAAAVAAATRDQLADVPGIGEKTAEKILASARGDATADAGE